MTSRDDLAARAHALIDRLADGSRDDNVRDALLADLIAHQAARIAPWSRLLAARGVDPRSTGDPARIPALPSDVFRHARVAVHAEEADRRVFRTSGTTHDLRGVRPLADLALYDHAARVAARHALFPDVDRLRLVVLAPDAHEAPDSSLSYMLARFDDWFGDGPTRYVWRDGRLDIEQLTAVLSCAERDGAPVALLGTSFAFVHAEDDLRERHFRLPSTSRIMQTGGFKGRSRTVTPEDMRTLLGERYGVPRPFIVAEYGMTELSSQMYETSLRDALAGRIDAPRRLWVPGWVRADVVDPEHLAKVPDEAIGILRIDDCANLDTPCAIQTADLARRLGDGIVVLGRDADATPRGCSLAADEALGANT